MVEVEHASILLDFFFDILSGAPFALKPQEWFQVESDGTGTIGITQAGLSPKKTGEVSRGGSTWPQVAQRSLGEIVYCRLPEQGTRFKVPISRELLGRKWG